MSKSTLHLNTAAAVRQHVIDSLQADLIGPYDLRHPDAEELLALPPSRWYLTGFLAPDGARQGDDPGADDELGVGSDAVADDTGGTDPVAKPKRFLPASIGLTVLIPAPAGPDESVAVTVDYADYRAEPAPGWGNGATGEIGAAHATGGAAVRTCDDGSAHDDGVALLRRPLLWFRRQRRGPLVLSVPLSDGALQAGVRVPGSGGVELWGMLVPAEAPGLPAGCRALSLFMVNRREPVAELSRADEAFIFQVGLSVHVPQGILPRPNLCDRDKDDLDGRIADLQYRQHAEYAVGHGVAVGTAAPVEDADGVARVHTAFTRFMPLAEVPRVESHQDPAVVTSMDALGALTSAEALRAALEPLCAGYGRWLAAAATRELDHPRRREVLAHVLERAEQARARMQAGIDALCTDALLRRAFCLANQAMALAARRRLGIAEPGWRLFQLGFVLLNLNGLADPAHADREVAELIFFPTGGGKTEAYLGVIACLLLLRRLRRQDCPDGGLGVAVILRYTLRLLTLDQLGRAATLICALETLRQAQPDLLGRERFAVGLWVGQSATPRTLAEAAQLAHTYRAGTGGSPFPLTHCPYCGAAIKPHCLQTTTSGRSKSVDDVVVGCDAAECPYSLGRNRAGLPVLFVDEQIYRELPAFVLATVDKFAMVPWLGQAGKLFGRVSARAGARFFGPADDAAPRSAVALPDGVLPPELIVQDELHLISGPLGTMVGLYETAIDYLCQRKLPAGTCVGPKLIASTATVRRAQTQIRALYGKRQVAVFPPPESEAQTTYFSRPRPAEPGRLYLGVAAPGRAMKALLLRVYVALLGAANRCFDRGSGPDGPADGYMTLVGYFNSLRELGGMRRLCEDEIRARVALLAERRPEGARGAHLWLRQRRLDTEPLELTSRETTDRVAHTKAQLGRHAVDPDAVDVVLASNMISVGVDIDRLALMVVAGQPKSISEYIQATSRVGRKADRPGLVVTCLNVHKPRDRSHYERFTAVHETFYRDVEASTVTPFSGPSLDRGLAGALVAMTRFAAPELTHSRGAMNIREHPGAGRAAAAALGARAAAQPTFGESAEHMQAQANAVTQRALGLLQAWDRVIEQSLAGAGQRVYSPFERPKDRALLRTALDGNDELCADERSFTAPTSMRDVEPTVNFWLCAGALGEPQGD